MTRDSESLFSVCLTTLTCYFRESADTRNLSIVYIATRAVVFTLMAKTQIDERRYIMPQLRRYELLKLEIIYRELHSHEAIERLL